MQSNKRTFFDSSALQSLIYFRAVKVLIF